MPPLLLVALGGALGSVARALLAGALNPAQAPVAARPGWASFPTGTLLINLIGCAAIGLIAGWLTNATARGATPAAHWHPLLLTGTLGGFTTFSAFGLETVLLLRAGHFAPAAAYIAASTALGITLAWAGFTLTSRG